MPIVVQRNASRSPLRNQVPPAPCKEVFGRGLTIMRKLGEGGFGAAYLCEPTADAPVALRGRENRFIVVKVATAAGQQMGVHKEVAALRRLNHPGIVQILDTWLEVGPTEFRGALP
jgi:serine/threonine protein kinase